MATAARAPTARTAFRNEPLTDFSREEARAGDAAALWHEVKPQLGRTYPPVIGKQAGARPRRLLDSVNPSHHPQIVGRCGRATAAQAEQAIAAAAAAFPGWRDTEPRGRADYLFRAADGDAAAALRAGGLGGLRVRQAVARGRRRRGRGHRLLRVLWPGDAPAGRAAHRDVPGEENVYFYEPRGVAVVIAPWNFPLAILCGMTTAALVTGNTVIMKPAEQSSVDRAPS